MVMNKKHSIVTISRKQQSQVTDEKVQRVTEKAGRVQNSGELKFSVYLSVKALLFPGAGDCWPSPTSYKVVTSPMGIHNKRDEVEQASVLSNFLVLRHIYTL